MFGDDDVAGAEFTTVSANAAGPTSEGVAIVLMRVAFAGRLGIRDFLYFWNQCRPAMRLLRIAIVGALAYAFKTSDGFERSNSADCGTKRSQELSREV